jgi:hypothetical protein
MCPDATVKELVTMCCATLGVSLKAFRAIYASAGKDERGGGGEGGSRSGGSGGVLLCPLSVGMSALLKGDGRGYDAEAGASGDRARISGISGISGSGITGGAAVACALAASLHSGRLLPL